MRNPGCGIEKQFRVSSSEERRKQPPQTGNGKRETVLEVQRDEVEKFFSTVNWVMHRLRQ
jgi:hypothetical protein